ncbi:MAG: tetratricopeptide repeat protein [Blastocatellales bacterium]
MRRANLTFGLIVLMSVSVFAQQAPVCHTPIKTQTPSGKAELIAGYGDVRMKVTTKSSEAQRFFDQGLSLLHSFWFYEADKSFERAAQLDPECAMAQWGIAMASVNDERRNGALKRAKELTAGVSEHERLYIEAVDARYNGERSNVQNNGFLGASESYRTNLRKIVARYPDDLEAKLFLALASMSGYKRDGTPEPGTVEAIALLQLVLARSPKHLAAHHYMIHATESGPRPQDGVPSADIYGTLAPKVGHAVHMPGHTYVHVDRWDDAARAFEGSAAVDREWIRANKEKSDHAAGPYGHNVHFLAMVYGYQGRYQDAVRVSRELLSLDENPEEVKSRTVFEGRLAMLRTLVRFEKWDEILNTRMLPEEGPFEVFKAWRYYAQAVSRIGMRDAVAAQSQLEVLEREVAWLKDRFEKSKDRPQNGRQSMQLRALKVAPLDVRARLLALQGKADEAIATAREAIEAEIGLGYSEPPLYPVPMQEVAGNIALSLRRWEDALGFFTQALERDPGSGRAYLGLSQAQKALGRHDDARRSHQHFLEAWAKADKDLINSISGAQ